MIATSNTKNAQRALELAIIEAFFLPGSAAHIATAFSTGAKRLHADDIYRIWEGAKARGDLPRLDRPDGGPRERILVPLKGAKIA
jgi:hypothetical protein